MSRAAALFLLSSIAIALGGCASYAGIHGEEREVAPHELAFDSSAVSNGVFVAGEWPRADWWSMFGDPKLDALVAAALASSPTLRTAEARVRGTHALADAARSALYPTLDLNGSAGRQRVSKNDLIYGSLAGSEINQGRITLDFAYEFDFWGKHRDELAAALGDARAAEADSAAARLVLAAAVAQTYFQIESDLATEDVVKQTLADRERLRELNRQRASRGLDTSIPARQSDQQVASSRVDVSAAEAAVRLDRHQLAALAGMGPDAPLDLQPTLHTYEHALALPADLPADLLARRPDIAAQRLRVEAAAARVGAAKADFYPNVNLAAFIGLDTLALHGLNLLSAGSAIAGVGPAIHLPVFEAGQLQANLRGRYGEYDAAVAEYNQTLVEALHQVADQIVNMRAVRQQLTDQAGALAAAEDAYRLTLDRYRAGLTNYLDVLVNEQRLLDERLNRVRLQRRSLALVVETIRALGGGYDAQRTIAEGAHR
jgi:NodT family efflux transporter outer membrane factor (OMF) lipoprotein